MSFAILTTRSMLGLVGAPTNPTAARPVLTLNLEYAGAPYVGAARAMVFAGHDRVSLVATGTGPVLRLYLDPASIGRTVDLMVSAAAGPGVVTGLRNYTLPAVNTTLEIELDVAATIPPDTSIVGRVAGDLIGHASAVPHEVIAFGLDGFEPRYLGRDTPDGAGHYDISWHEYTGRVIAVAVGDQGQPWTADHTYSPGDVIEPSSGYTGRVYVITDGGNSGSTEPEWWSTSGQTGAVGTATAVCRAYPRPQATGPVLPHVTVTP